MCPCPTRNKTKDCYIILVLSYSNLCIRVEDVILCMLLELPFFLNIRNKYSPCAKSATVCILIIIGVSISLYYALYEYILQ